MAAFTPSQAFHSLPLLPPELQIYILHLALLAHWPSAQLDLKWLSPRHGTLKHSQLPILTSPVTYQTPTSFPPCCYLDTGTSPGVKIFRNQWLHKSEDGRAVVRMMHINKLSRQVVLEHWRRELVQAEYEHESRDIIVGVLDELIRQTRRFLPPAPTTFYRFQYLPIELKVRIWKEALRDYWHGSAFSNFLCLTLTPWLGKGHELPILSSSRAGIYTRGALRCNGSSEIAILRLLATHKLSRAVVLDRFRNYFQGCDRLNGLREGLLNVVDELLAQTRRLKLWGPKTFTRFEELPAELQIRIWKDAIFEHWGAAQMSLAWLSLEHASYMHDEKPFLVTPATHTTSASTPSYAACCACESGRSPGIKVFVRRQYNEERKAQETVLWMMHTNKFSRQVVLKYWKAYLMMDDWNRDVRDVVVHVLDQLLDQNQRPLKAVLNTGGPPL